MIIVHDYFSYLKHPDNNSRHVGGQKFQTFWRTCDFIQNCTKLYKLIWADLWSWQWIYSTVECPYKTKLALVRVFLLKWKEYARDKSNTVKNILRYCDERHQATAGRAESKKARSLKESTILRIKNCRNLSPKVYL